MFTRTNCWRAFALGVVFVLSLMITPVSQAQDKAHANETKLKTTQITSIEWEETTIKDAIAELKRKTGLNFVIDKDVDGDETVSLELSGVNAKQVLDIMLKQKELARLHKDGVIWIVEEDDKNKKAKLTTRLYDIRDITMPIRDFKGPNVKTGEVDDADDGNDRDIETTDDIIELVEDSVEPDLWGNDGYAIVAFKGQLIVTASTEVHGKVSNLLALLR